VCVCVYAKSLYGNEWLLQVQTTFFEALFVQRNKSIQLALRSLHAGSGFDWPYKISAVMVSSKIEHAGRWRWYRYAVPNLLYNIHRRFATSQKIEYV
jgi:hypothetical protein